MRRVFFILFIALFCGKIISQPYKNNFISGEKLKFIIYYGIINAGIVEAELNSVEYGNTHVYHGKMLARSVGLADKLYKVRVTLEREDMKDIM